MKSRFPIVLTALALQTGCGAATGARTERDSSYPGFDTQYYPGDEVMAEWRRSSPYRWVGYYLQAPCHRDASFSGRRSFLTQQGWGIAVLYVGQQAFEGQAPTEITPATLCTSQFLTAERGAADGRDAAAGAAAEGFPRGTTIFLDVERVGVVGGPLVDYYLAWIQTVQADGRYRPGTYAHLSNAAALYSLGQAALLRAGVTESMPFWVAGADSFTLSAVPSASGYSFATVWQGALNVTRTWGGRSLQIDENVATAPSPSSPAP